MYCLEVKMLKKVAPDSKELMNIAYHKAFLGITGKKRTGSFFEFIRTNVHLNVQIKEQLTEQEQKVYNLIRYNERITKSEIAKRINKSEKTVQRVIASLIYKKLITRVGSNKDGYWKIIE